MNKSSLELFLLLIFNGMQVESIKSVHMTYMYVHFEINNYDDIVLWIKKETIINRSTLIDFEFSVKISVADPGSMHFQPLDPDPGMYFPDPVFSNFVNLLLQKRQG